jgi:hypothetical protein
MFSSMPGKLIRSLTTSVVFITLLSLSILPSSAWETTLSQTPTTPFHNPDANRKARRTLWPGSRFTEADRRRAVRRGLRFIYRTALDEKNFEQYGSDYLWCFYTVSESVSDAGLRRMARRMGRERARRWRETHRSLRAGATAQQVSDFAFGSDAADSLGLRDDKLKEQIRRAASRLTAHDFLLFDPAREPPPEDVPDECEFDKLMNERGATACRRCGRPLKMRTRADVWYDALITAYVGDRFGVRLGAEYSDVLKLLPTLHPYRGHEGGANAEFYDTVYAVTHVVYTLNDYGQRTLAPRLLPDEFEFLRANLREAIAQGDADMLGEFMDSLRAFGLTDRDDEIRAGMEYLLARQNADGSWGDSRERDIYLRYHPTWNGVAALSNYAWRAGGPTPAKLRALTAVGASLKDR